MSVAGCPRCGHERHRGRCKKVKAAQPEPAPEPVAISSALEVERGYGFRATAENGSLVIEQDADDGTATVVLSRTELRVLAAQFLPWAEKAA